MRPMLAPWTLLSGVSGFCEAHSLALDCDGAIPRLLLPTLQSFQEGEQFVGIWWGDGIFCPALEVKLAHGAGLLFCLHKVNNNSDRRHSAEDSCTCILLNENVLISIKISLKFNSKGPITNITALV